MAKYTEIKREAYEANMEIPKQNLAIYTFGNVSSFDAGSGVFAIKPSGVPYDRLRPEKMVVVDIENNAIVEGSLRPSSDTKTHSVLYRVFKEIGGICHTHSPYAVAWAQALKPVPILGTTHADHLVTDIPVTGILADEAIKKDYEEETGNQIVKCFKNLNYKEIEMVLVACHGPFSWGKNALKSVYNSKVLEEIAKIALYTIMINPDVPVLKKSLKEKHYFRKHGTGAYYGQND